jgi:hypothetical protein
MQLVVLLNDYYALHLFNLDSNLEVIPWLLNKTNIITGHNDLQPQFGRN